MARVSQYACSSERRTASAKPAMKFTPCGERKTVNEALEEAAIIRCGRISFHRQLSCSRQIGGSSTSHTSWWPVAGIEIGGWAAGRVASGPAGSPRSARCVQP